MIPDAATIGLWRLDEAGGGNAVDVGPNGLTGINSGTTPVAVVGMPFVYARQVAASQGIDISHSALLEPANPSVECWFRWAGTNGSDQYLISKNNQYHLLYWSATDIFAYYVRSNGSSWIVASCPASSIVVGDWYQLAGTLDGSFVRLHLNGVEVNKTAWTGSITYSGTEALGIGNLVTGKTAYFNGQIAEVRLSNRARAPWEIYNTWQGLKARDPVAGFGVES